MSDRYLHVIPDDPHHVPSNDKVEKAMLAFRQAFPTATTLTVETNPTVEMIVDAKAFDQVKCPHCGEAVYDWWSDTCATAHEAGYTDLHVTTPCCNRESKLQDLDYGDAVAFARFSLIAANVDYDDVTEEKLLPIAEALGCKTRVAWDQI